MNDLAALDGLFQEPLLLDGHGSLYGLQRSASSEWRAKPEALNADPCLGFGRLSAGGWICTTKHLAIRDARSGAVAAKALGKLWPFTRVPDYGAVFAIDAGDRVLLAVAGRDGTFCVDLQSAGANEFMLDRDYRYFSGWRRADTWFLAGMKTRQLEADSLVDWGTAALAEIRDGKVRLRNLDVEISPFLQKTTVRGMQKSATAQSYSGWRVEACVDSFTAADVEVLICPLIPDTPDQDTDWLFSESLRREDHHVFAVARHRQRAIEAVDCCVEAGSYVGRVPMQDGSSQLLFLPTSKIHAGAVPLYGLTIGPEARAVQSVAGSITGLGTEQQVSFLAVHQDETAGFYGCVGAYTDFGHRYHLMTSADGCNWRVTQNLREYAR
jgi:hypothetical protein